MSLSIVKNIHCRREAQAPDVIHVYFSHNLKKYRLLKNTCNNNVLIDKRYTFFLL